jgi:glycerophosphoryl diester phosphodiesterase
LPCPKAAYKMAHVDVRTSDAAWMRLPLGIIAHRGANREAPENTLAAFSRALEIGVQGIELDVQMTLDGVPVVRHDPTLPDGRRIAQTDSRDLEDIPPLVDVLSLVDGRCHVYVEIKAPAAVDRVCALLYGHTEWCSVHSFDHRVALRAAKLASSLGTGILLVSYLVDVESAMMAATARDVWQQADLIDPQLVIRVHRAGGRVIAWTVNEPGRALSLMELGVDGICTDTPREMLRDFGV